MAKKKPSRSLAGFHPIDGRYTEVLGCGVRSASGKRLWDELDWAEWYIDGPGRHIFNPGGGLYLHVRCKHDPEQDGPNPADRRWYRVRCALARKGFDIGIAHHDGKLSWIVRVKPLKGDSK